MTCDFDLKRTGVQLMWYPYVVGNVCVDPICHGNAHVKQNVYTHMFSPMYAQTTLQRKNWKEFRECRFLASSFVVYI